MKITQKSMAVVLCLLAAAGVSNAFATVFDGGWRISAGAVYDSGVRSNIKFAPNQTYTSPYTRSAGAKATRKEAEEAAWGKVDSDHPTRTVFVNERGNGSVKSYVDIDDPNFSQGGNDKTTWKYSFPAEEPVWAGNTPNLELGYSRYEEIDTTAASFDSMKSHDKDEYAMPGVSVQLSRNLYHNVEYHWGIEAAFAVQYFRRNHIFNSSSSWGIGRSTKSSGERWSNYTMGGDLGDLMSISDQWTAGDRQIIFNGNDAFGENNWFNPIELSKNTKNGADGGYVPTGINQGSSDNETETDVQRGALDMDGDYENLELMFLLQPYYDIFDWLSINATLGPVVSRQSAEMSFLMVRNGQIEYQSKRDFYQWDVYGVAGLGFMLYYEGFTLSGDFMARFFDDDMEIKDEHYHGTIGRGHWMFRLGVGYEF